MTMPEYRAQKVLLVGMTGSGKTTVGTALSSRLSRHFLDSDAMLERTTGQTAADILVTDGPQALQAAESRVLTFMLGMPTLIIGAVASGVVVHEPDRMRLAATDAHVVWLRASPKVLARRLSAATKRTQPASELEADLRRVGLDRNPFYEQVADQVIDVDALAVGVIAKLVVEELEIP